MLDRRRQENSSGRVSSLCAIFLPSSITDSDFTLLGFCQELISVTVRRNAWVFVCGGSDSSCFDFLNFLTHHGLTSVQRHLSIQDPSLTLLFPPEKSSFTCAPASLSLFEKSLTKVSGLQAISFNTSFVSVPGPIIGLSDTAAAGTPLGPASSIEIGKVCLPYPPRTKDCCKTCNRLGVSNMRLSIPRLEDYDISPIHGFLPEEPPLELLPNPYYDRWESIVRNLQGLLLSRRLRGVVDRLPILSTHRLRSEPEWRRAYSILAFITHAFIWGGDAPAEVCNV